MRVGVGFDAHPLVPGRPLVLGGVTVPFPRGLEGHSDGDVLCHALMDALLGATALGDKGALFPPDDPSLRGISSLLLLERVASLLAEEGWRVVNVDATIVAQMPKLSPFMAEMRNNIARALGTDPSRVGIKATTTDRMGFVGRGEGISAVAVALVEEAR